MGFSRQQHWFGLPSPSPGDLPDSGIEPASPTLAGRFFTTRPPGTSLQTPVQRGALGGREPWRPRGKQGPGDGSQPLPPPRATASALQPPHPRAAFSPPRGFWLFSQKEAGAETSSFYSALLRIQPKIVHCWRPMRRTFKAYDEGGTGFLSVADFRKVSRLL